MAKEHWLVAVNGVLNRERVVGYRVYIGKEPQRTKGGHWPGNRRSIYLGVTQLEAIRRPKRLPEPGGSPMLLGCW